jgi:hypothetical protein
VGQLDQDTARVGEAGVRLALDDLAVGGAAHQAVHGADRRHAAAQDVVEIGQSPAADDRHAILERLAQTGQHPRAAGVGPDIVGTRHDRRQRAVEVENSAQRRGRSTGGGGRSTDSRRETV